MYKLLWLRGGDAAGIGRWEAVAVLPRVVRVSLSQTSSSARPPLFSLPPVLISAEMHTSEYDYLFKLLLIGDSGVGKVCDSLCHTSCVF